MQPCCWNLRSRGVRCSPAILFLPQRRHRRRRRKAAIPGRGLTASAHSILPRARSRNPKIKLPAGFSIALWAENVRGARTMTLAPDGTVFVGTWNMGNVYALSDRNKDNRADAVITVASGLTMPNGVAFKNGTLYVAEVNRIVRFDRCLAQSNPGWRRSPRRSSSTSCRPIATTGGNICASDLTAISIPLSAPPVTSARSPRPTRAFFGSSPTEAAFESVRPWHPQHRWFHLASGHARALVHRQRQGHARRRAAERRTERRGEGGVAFRLPVLPRGINRGSAIRERQDVFRLPAPRRRSWGRTSRHWASPSMSGSSFPPNTRSGCSSPSTGRGTGCRRPAIAGIASWLPV